MAITATMLLNARSDKNILDMQENRTRTFGAIEMVESDTANLLSSGDITEKRVLDNRVVEIPVLNRLDRTTSSTNTRSCSPTVEDSVSALQGISWNTETFYTTMCPVEHENNEISMQKKFNHQLESGIRGALENIEATVYSTLNTNRTQLLEVESMDSVIAFNGTTDQLDVPYADRSEMWNHLKYIMRENAFMPGFNVVGSWGMFPSIDYYVNQGKENSVNTSYQFGDYNFYGSAGITNDAANIGTFFVMPKGSVAIVYWVSKQAKIAQGTQTSGADGLMTYSTANVPMIGEMARKTWTTCVDKSATLPGVTDAVVINDEYSIDYAVIPLYNSSIATQTNAIVKGAIVGKP